MATLFSYLIGICSFVHLSMQMQALPQYCSSSRIPNKSGPKLPKIPDNFMATVERLDPMSNSSMAFSMFVNWKAKKISTIRHLKGGNFQELYDYNSELKMSAGPGLPNEGFCQATVSPFGPIGFSNFSKDKVSFADVLFYGEKYNLSYMGVMRDIRGIRCHTWQGCVNTNNMSIANYFFFSANWTMSGQKEPKFVAYGTGGYVAVGSRVRNVSLTYDFVNINVGPPPPQKMNFPPGIYCEDPGSKCMFPKIPLEFEMNAEMTQQGRKDVRNSREYFDSKEKFHRSDHHHNNSKGVQVPIHEIHDYNTGISYVIDSTTMKCAMSPIPLKSWDGLETLDHHHIRMRSSSEFFGLNVKKYGCKGSSSIRGIPADVMVSTRNGTRSNPTEKLIQEWYFSRPDWKVNGMEGPINTTRVPLQHVWYHKNGSVLFNINYFNFDPVETTTHILWILRYCYVNNRHYMYFRLDSPYDKYGISNRKDVISALRDALAKAAGISHLRVSSILLFKSGYSGVIAVRLYVLGVPAVGGSVTVLHPKHEVPLTDAVNKIKNAITAGNLIATVRIYGQSSATVLTMKAQKASYYDNFIDGPDPVKPKKKDAKPSRAGVSSGAAAGITIAIFLLAVVLTVVAVNFILKRRGVNLFQYSRYNNEQTA